MDAVKDKLAEVQKAIDNILSHYGLTINSPSLETISDEDWNKVCDLRDEEGKLETMISFRNKLKQDSGEFSFPALESKTKTIPVNDKARIGKRIAELRKERGVSQAKLGQLTGISSSNIGKIELAQYNPGLETLCKIADALGFMVDFVPVSPELCSQTYRGDKK